MNRKGQALVEFVIILPIFILILFAIVDFGVILSKKNELENISIDIVTMLNNDEDISDIRKLYPELSIDVSTIDEYQSIKISLDVDIITPGLNLVLGDPYKVTVERTIPYD